VALLITYETAPEQKECQRIEIVSRTETWRHDVDSGLLVGVAFVDFRKAVVNHEILLNKLQCRFGIRGPLLAWDMSRQDDFDALERLLCKAARIIYKFPKDMPSAEVLARAKWDTLRTRYKLSILKLSYRMFHHVSPSCMSIHISKLQPSYKLRRSHLIVIPSFRTNIMKSSIAYRGAILWNHLPGECHKAAFLGSFIKSIHEQNAIKDIDFSNLCSKTF